MNRTKKQRESEYIKIKKWGKKSTDPGDKNDVGLRFANTATTIVTDETETSDTSGTNIFVTTGAVSNPFEGFSTHSTTIIHVALIDLFVCMCVFVCRFKGGGRIGVEEIEIGRQRDGVVRQPFFLGDSLSFLYLSFYIYCSFLHYFPNFFSFI